MPFCVRRSAIVSMCICGAMLVGGETERSVPKKPLHKGCRRVVFTSDLIAKKKIKETLIKEAVRFTEKNTNNNNNEATQRKLQTQKGCKSPTPCFIASGCQDEFKRTHVRDASHTRSFSSGAQRQGVSTIFFSLHLCAKTEHCVPSALAPPPSSPPPPPAFAMRPE